MPGSPFPPMFVHWCRICLISRRSIRSFVNAAGITWNTYRFSASCRRSCNPGPVRITRLVGLRRACVHGADGMPESHPGRSFDARPAGTTWSPEVNANLSRVAAAVVDQAMDECVDLLLAGRRKIELAPHLGEPVVDLPELVVDAFEAVVHVGAQGVEAGHRGPTKVVELPAEVVEFPAEVVEFSADFPAEVGEFPAQAGDLAAEASHFTTQIGDVTVSGPGQHPRGLGVLLAGPYPPVQVADFGLQSRAALGDAVGGLP